MIIRSLLVLLAVTISVGQITMIAKTDFDMNRCSKVECSEFGDCLNCQFPKDCVLGERVEVNCTTVKQCVQRQSVKKETQCRFCWQTESWEHSCEPVANCSTTSTVKTPVKCKVHDDIICLGRRSFYKKVRCDWTSGHSWSRTLFLSIVLGGFGADRFYLGLWKSAIGKLFSFGGLGVWTIVDIVLIATGYIRPADGSNYV